MELYKDWQQPIRWAWSLVHSLASTPYDHKPSLSTMLLLESQRRKQIPNNRSLYDQVWHSASPTAELSQSSLFKSIPLSLSIEDRTRLTYERAKVICDAYSSFLILFGAEIVILTVNRADDRGCFASYPKILEVTDRLDGGSGWWSHDIDQHPIQSLCGYCCTICDWSTGSSINPRSCYEI